MGTTERRSFSGWMTNALNWLLPERKTSPAKRRTTPTTSVELLPEPALRVPTKLSTAVVHLKTDQVIKGALVRVDSEAVVLRHASLAVNGPSGSVNWSRMDGEIVITTGNIDFWQEGLDAGLLDRTIDLPTR